MDSQLRPRDIQVRIRAGESAEEVALAAGVPVERIDAFAAPVLAERAHVVGMAQAAPVRRRGETASARALRSTVTQRLLSQGVDVDDVTWDAWKRNDGKWVVKAGYESEGADRQALFVHDLGARFSLADNDDARWLIEERAPVQAPATHAQADPDTEPTVDLDDELALVRATLPESGPGAFAADEEVPDYAPAELTEVDGVYDLVAPSSEMDVLYEMISGIDEDSVRIYTELQVPVSFDEPEQLSLIDAAAEFEEEAHDPAESGLDDGAGLSGRTVRPAYSPATTGPDPAPAAATSIAAQPDRRRQRSRSRQEEPDISRERGADVPGGPGLRDTDPDDTPDLPPIPNGFPQDADEAEPSTSHPSWPAKPTTTSGLARPSGDASAPPVPPDEQPPTAPAKRTRGKRASVPSWDEIMFGSKE